MSCKSETERLVGWMDLALEGWQLWGEAASVIWLRSWRIAGGGAAGRKEATRMVSEKVSASLELGVAMLGQPLQGPEQATRTSLRHYRSKVRSNHRRLAGLKRGGGSKG